MMSWHSTGSNPVHLNLPDEGRSFWRRFLFDPTIVAAIRFARQQPVLDHGPPEDGRISKVVMGRQVSADLALAVTLPNRE
jgi:hypothetical protein